MQKMKHRVQLFPDGSGPRRFDVQKVIVHPGEVSSKLSPFIRMNEQSSNVTLAN